MTEWFMHRDGEQLGPYSLQDLKQFVTEGRLDKRDMFWNAELNKWIPFKEMKLYLKAEEVKQENKTMAGEITRQKRLPVKTAALLKKFKPLHIGLAGGTLFLIILLVVLLSANRNRLPISVLPDMTDMESLSTDQKVLYALLGAPDHFAIVFNREPNGLIVTRLETWAFEHLNYYYLFENGIYLGGWRAPYQETLADEFNFTPMHFQAEMNSGQVITLMGRNPESIEESEGFISYIFGNGVLTFTFDSEDRLVTVIRIPEVKDSI